MVTRDQPRNDGWDGSSAPPAAPHHERPAARPGSAAVWRAHRLRLLTLLTASRAWGGGWRNPARARCSRRA